MSLAYAHKQVPLSVPPPSYVSLMVTRRCNMSCGHCSVESSPQVKGEPTETELLDIVRQAATTGVKIIQVTGGEPMLREQVVLRLVRECRQLGVVSVMTTNGFWGKSLTQARRRLKALRRAGLGALTVSYDRYHAEFQGPQPALNIAQAAEEINFSVNINIVRVAEDPELQRIITPFAEVKSAHLRFYDVQAVGRARMLPVDSLRSEIEGFCGAAAFPAITDDGRVTACNGPSYFAGPESPLFVGSLRETPLPALFERHQQDPILDTIRTFGPARLRDELGKIPEFETFPFRQRYHGLCDLCHHITTNPEAVSALRTRLSQPQFVAERVAARRVIENSKSGGAMSWRYVNGIGACRVFLQAAQEPAGPWAQGAERILGRADFDWHHQAAYLTACGLARPLLRALPQPVVMRWAPQFFIERIKTAAMQDGFKELVQREALRQIAAVLQEVGGTGVLLKGAARLALAGEDESASVPRATGDLDVYIAPSLAPTVRRKLIDLGWRGAVDAPRTAPHHLAPVSFQGIPLEIHTQIMPSFWGLPEKDMLAHIRPLPGQASLYTLDAEGFLLHAGMHTTTNLFSLGLKTAWDFLWVLQKFAQLDWDRLTQWVSGSRLPRGFWVPVRVLYHELAIPFPHAFLSCAPADARQRKLETIARHRLFYELEGPFDLNPFSKNAVFLWLHDSWIDRARYLATLAGGTAAEARHSAQRNVASQSLSQLPQQFRQALLHWRQYRRALANAITEPGV